MCLSHRFSLAQLCQDHSSDMVASVGEGNLDGNSVGMGNGLSVGDVVDMSWSMIQMNWCNN